MISNYEIRKYDNEEVLYLYLDLDDEFAKINFKEKIDKFDKVIKDFIRDNKIAFRGTAVALVVGGTLVGNVYLNKQDDNNYYVDNFFTAEERFGNLPTELEENIEVEDEIIEEDNEEKDQNIEVKDDISQDKETSNIKEDANKNFNVNTNSSSSNNITSNSNNTSSNNTPTNGNEKKEENKQEEVKDNRVYVSVRRSSGNVVNIELEEYVIGVVGAEMPAAFNDEALKAQAVIARTYALKAILKGQTLTDNSSTQNYKNNDELRSMWGSGYNNYYNKVKNAVNSTKGTYLTYNGTYIEAVYHSTSNGRTEDASNVWGNYFPYLVSVDSPYDSSNKSFEMDTFISYSDLSSKLGMNINKDSIFNILGKTSGNRVSSIEVNGKVYSGVDFRNKLGLRSADFDINMEDSGITFKTKGYGHGVGMSQYGANGMANNGYSYSDILKHYYSGVTISYQ